MREKEAYSRPEMEVLRFGDRTITTESLRRFNMYVGTIGCDETDRPSPNGCGFDISLRVFGT